MKRSASGDAGNLDLTRGELTKVVYRDRPEELHVHEIPLPTEIPQPVDLSEIPEHLLKSGTIEMLIQQNEDLLARLSVSLRRNSKLESRLQQRESEFRNLTLENSSLSDQLLVYQEKDRGWKGRIQKAEEKQKEAEEDLRLTALKLRELENASRQRIENLEVNLAQYKKDREHLQSYQRRVRQFVRPQLREWRSQLSLQQERISELQSMILDKELRYTAIQERLAEMMDHIKAQSEIHKNDIELLSEQMQKEINNRDSEIVSLKRQLNHYEAKAKRLDLLLEEQIDWENRLIRSERLREETLERYNKDLAAYKDQILAAKGHNAQLQRENDEMNRAIFTLNSEFEQIRQQFSAIHEQKENLQLVWRDNKRYIEELEVKEQTLQKLNQDLSARLNDMRRQMEAESTRAASQQLKSDLKSKALNEELSLVRRQMVAEPSPQIVVPELPAAEVIANAQAHDLAPSTAKAAPSERDQHQQMLKHIEHLLGELQVGICSDHERNAGLFEPSLPDMNFLEEAKLTLAKTTAPSSKESRSLAERPEDNSDDKMAAQSAEIDLDPDSLERQESEDFVNDAVEIAFKRLEEKRRQAQTPPPTAVVLDRVSLNDVSVPEMDPESPISNNRSFLGPTE